jgi:hypothetical protein
VSVSATRRARKNLEGIGDSERIKGNPHCRLGMKVMRSEHQWHEIAFLKTDAVLTGKDTPSGDTDSNNFFSGGMDSFHDSWFALVKN